MIARLLAPLLLLTITVGGAWAQASSLYQPMTSADLVTAMQIVPIPSSAAPPATALDGARGSAVEFARADHTHAVRVQRTVLVTAADGTATWTFARPIAVPAGMLPPTSFMVEDTGSPVVVQVVGRAMTSNGTTDMHTAVSIKAQRSQLLPGALVSLSVLLNFNVFGGPVSGVKVNIWAADPTQ